MSRPERGTPEYDVYKAQKRATREALNRGNLLAVDVASQSRQRSSSRRRDSSRRREASYSEDSASDASRRPRHRERERSRSRAPSRDPRQNGDPVVTIEYEDEPTRSHREHRREEPRKPPGDSSAEQRNGHATKSSSVYVGNPPPASYQPDPYAPPTSYSPAPVGGSYDNRPGLPGAFPSSYDGRSQSTTPPISSSQYQRPYDLTHHRDERSPAPGARPIGANGKPYNPQQHPASYRASTSPDKGDVYAAAPPAGAYAADFGASAAGIYEGEDSRHKRTGSSYEHGQNVHAAPASGYSGAPFVPTGSPYPSTSLSQPPGTYTTGTVNLLEHQAPPSPNPFQYQTGGPDESALASHHNVQNETTAPSFSSIHKDHASDRDRADEKWGHGRSSSTYSESSKHPDVYGITGVSSAALGGGSLKPARTSLTVSTGGIPNATPGTFMPSPALQPYHGTYQSISPMPSPSFGPSSPAYPVSPMYGPSRESRHKPKRSEDFSLGPPAYPQGRDKSRTREKSRDRRRDHSRVRSRSRSSSRSGSPNRKSSGYDPNLDAKALLSELKSTFSRPSPKPVISILPTLTSSELLALRAEYKSLYRGVNLAKHLKSVFTTSTPFGKAIFAVALGPYESEAWFANSWYQKRETRNELLIESLMGKSNYEISKIKAAFRDAKYDSSLEKAVQEELPNNKFRLAVMLQLSGSKMDEDQKISVEGVKEDVARLGTILERRPTGGETEMVELIVMRSEAWLREVAITYRSVYDRDLMKAVIQRSQNLVVSRQPSNFEGGILC